MDNVSVNSEEKILISAAEPNNPSTSSDLVSLNFKIPFSIRQQFKIYAAQHDMTMTELVLKLIVALHVKPDKMPELKRETFTA